jgi:hypothetical protein
MMRRSWRMRIKSSRVEVRVIAKVVVVVEKGSCLLIGHSCLPLFGSTSSAIMHLASYKH